jgi:hypothetical protein
MTELTFNDKTYDTENLSKKAQYIVKQIEDLQGQSLGTRARLEQIEMSIKGFKEILAEELETSEEAGEEGA